MKLSEYPDVQKGRALAAEGQAAVCEAKEAMGESFDRGAWEERMKLLIKDYREAKAHHFKVRNKPEGNRQSGMEVEMFQHRIEQSALEAAAVGHGPSAFGFIEELLNPNSKIEGPFLDKLRLAIMERQQETIEKLHGILGGTMVPLLLEQTSNLQTCMDILETTSHLMFAWQSQTLKMTDLAQENAQAAEAARSGH